MPFSPDLVFLPPYGYDFSGLMLILSVPRYITGFA